MWSSRPRSSGQARIRTRRGCSRLTSIFLCFKEPSSVLAVYARIKLISHHAPPFIASTVGTIGQFCLSSIALVGAHIDMSEGIWVVYRHGTGPVVDIDNLQEQPEPPHQCSICLRDLDEDLRDLGWQCEHCGEITWCRTCVLKVVQANLRSQGRRLPSCACGMSADILEVYHLLPLSLWKENAERLRILSAKEPLFCAKEACSRFLQDNAALEQSESQGKSVSCGDCGTTTCRLCREVMTAHDDVEQCPVVNVNVRQRQLMEGTKMRNCQCGNVIEQNGGCSHMTCPGCRYEFCSICSKKWKTCGCPQFQTA